MILLPAAWCLLSFPLIQGYVLLSYYRKGYPNDNKAAWCWYISARWLRTGNLWPGANSVLYQRPGALLYALHTLPSVIQKSRVLKINKATQFTGYRTLIATLIVTSPLRNGNNFELEKRVCLSQNVTIARCELSTHVLSWCDPEKPRDFHALATSIHQKETILARWFLSSAIKETGLTQLLPAGALPAYPVCKNAPVGMVRVSIAGVRPLAGAGE